MEQLFRKQTKKSTVDMIIENIWQLLLTKKLLPGQKIPSESEIAEGLGVSRGSVREAMKILSAFGIVEIRVGDGTYIPSSPKSAIIDPLLFSFLIYNPDLIELSELRRILEMDIVELVILHRQENEKERQALFDNYQELINLRNGHAGPEAFANNDMEFHRLLGAACHNRLAQRIYDFVLSYLEQSIRDAHERQEQGVVAYEMHNRIIEAVRSNNLELAKSAIYHSVDAWQSLQESESKKQ